MVDCALLQGALVLLQRPQRGVLPLAPRRDRSQPRKPPAGSSRRTRGGKDVSWKLTGRYVENCSCTAICPCTWSGLAVPATTERCYGALTYHIDDGDIEGVDVSGLHVAVLTDSPALMLKGNWRVALVIDAKASDEQANKLEKVFYRD